MKFCTILPKNFFLLVNACLLSGFSVVHAQPNLSANLSENMPDARTTWQTNPFEQKAFIENRGQFDGKNGKENSTIAYGTDDRGAKIYFTPAGLSYCFNELEPVYETEKYSFFKKLVGKEEEVEVYAKVKSHMLHMTWLDASPNVQLISSGKVDEYFSYRKNEQLNKPGYDAVPGYQKLTYKGLYPGIDVEYVFHEKQGVKYSLIVHPGADLSKVKLQYSGEVTASLDAANNMHLITPLGEVVDHAPFTFYELAQTEGYEHNIIPSSFDFDAASNTLSFKVGEYDHNKTLIVDPWIITPNDLTNSLKALEIEKDALGNVYAYGGYDSYKVVKYDPTGKKIWVYDAGGGVGLFGDITVDPAGISYVSTANEILKLAADGSDVWFSTSTNFSGEYWRLDLSCNSTKLALAGSGGSGRIAYVDIKKGTVGNKTGTFNAIAASAEFRTLSMAPNGNWYGLTVAGAGSTAHQLVGVSSVLKNLFSVSSGYILNYYGPTYASAPVEARSGFNGTTTDQNYIYTTDGATLKKWKIDKGTLVKSATITGGLVEANGGIAVDSCGNIYVGSQANVIKFDSNLVVVTTGATNAPVYDVCIAPNGEILAGGAGFIASLALGSCKDVPCCPVIAITFTTKPAGCGASDGEATVTLAGGAAPYKYKWSSTPVQTGATAKNLPAGTYVVEITDALGCFKTASVVIPSTSGMADSIPTYSHVSCIGSTDGSATVEVAGGIPPYTFLWNTEPPQTTQTATGLPAGTYTCTVIDNNGCQVNAEVTIEEPFELVAGLVDKTDVSCIGASDGSANINVTGGTSPYRLLWNTNPPQTTNRATGLAAGDYFCAITDTNNCVVSVPVTIGIDQNAKEDCFSFVIPNAFSPNDNEANDNFKGIGKGIKEYDLTIFNRWGQEIFRTNDINEGWKGNFPKKGGVSPTGVYIYVVKLTDVYDKVHVYTGTVSLTR